jgi:hypothetical protein
VCEVVGQLEVSHEVSVLLRFNKQGCWSLVSPNSPRMFEVPNVAERLKPFFFPVIRQTDLAQREKETIKITVCAGSLNVSRLDQCGVRMTVMMFPEGRFAS